jgi:hypothetical protein
MRNGLGIYVYSSGTTYKGYWKDDKQHGEGIVCFKKDGKDGDRYEGYFENNMRHGQGTYKYADG